MNASSAASLGRVPLSWCTELEASILKGAAIGWNATTPAPLDALPTQHWPLVSLECALAIVGAYLGFVAVGLTFIPLVPAAPERVMYPLKFVYNVVQIFLCAYMSVEAGVLAYRNGYSLFPWPQNNPFNALNPVISNLMWLFYVSKILDFFDTFTIIMQQKWKQLSFLHVYHHASVFLFYWINVRLAYDGDIYLTILLNGAIHTVMYTYYFVAMHTKTIWWKKYLTQMQMVQFCLMMVQGALMIANQDASFPPRLAMAYFGYIVTMLGLFLHFYFQSYSTSQKERVSKAKSV